MKNSDIKNSNEKVNTNIKNVLSKELIVADSGVRLDAYVANNMVELSRSMVQKLIKSGNILVNNKEEKESYKVQAGDKILVKFQSQKKAD